VRPVDAAVERRAADRVSTATVMIVEDSVTTRRILRRGLELASYRVVEAGDGEEALALCDVEPPDLVLLDVDLPVLDGPQMLAQMQADDALAAIPVVFVTARTRGAEAADCLARGARDYIRKPCDIDELRARVALVLDRESERRHLRDLAEHADRLSLVDSLTGLANRRQFDRRRETLGATRPADDPVGLIVLDVDHFKHVNDDEGHLAGDTVLRILSRRLQTVLAAEDLLVRWGGEEFLVLAPGLDPADTQSLAERLHATVDAAPFAVPGHAALAITASVGWTSGRLGELDDLIPIADEALYEAKRAGRDRVVGAADAG
jgi:two-component system, cell cycle response regulator